MEIDYTIKDEDELGQLYLSFLKDGGIFIPTKTICQLGDMVQVNLMLLFEADQVFSFKGKIVLINPEGAQHHAMTGIGIQFIEPNAEAIRKKILAYLPAGGAENLTGIFS